MIKGIFNSSSGLQPRMTRLEVIANNLSNIGTSGYKKDSVFIQVLNDAALSRAQGAAELKGLDARQFTDFSSGGYRETGNPLDVAIEGRGFFAIETPKGTRYTRNGNFTMTVDGTIVTQQGYAVLGSGGRIRVPNATALAHGSVSISQQGDVTVDGKVIDSFRLVEFKDMAALRKEGEVQFSAGSEIETVPIDGAVVRLRQGVIEESNVDGIAEMMEMVELTRSFESDQKAVQRQDETIERLMEVGRV